jgi:hypothetical protein
VNNAIASSSASAVGAANRYSAGIANATNDIAAAAASANLPAIGGAAPEVQQAASASPYGASRYATAVTPAASTSSAAATTPAPAPATSAAVATAQPYRPGGTSTYPASNTTPIQVASRPQGSTSAPATNATAPTTGAATPAAATPAVATPTVQPTTTSRYW